MKYALAHFLCAAVFSTAAAFAQTGAANDPSQPMQQQAPKADKKPAPEKHKSGGAPNPRPAKKTASATPRATSGETGSHPARKSTPAADSASAQYRKSVMDAIGARWLAYVQPQRDSLALGTATVEFHIDAQGHATDIKVVANSSDEAFGNLCMQAVGDTALPELTPGVLSKAKNKPLEYAINFTLYPLPTD